MVHQAWVCGGCKRVVSLARAPCVTSWRWPWRQQLAAAGLFLTHCCAWSLQHPPHHHQVREVALEAIARARRGEGPTLIECETYRFRGHSLADPDELRSKEEKAHYQARDPIPRLRQVRAPPALLAQSLPTGPCCTCLVASCRGGSSFSCSLGLSIGGCGARECCGSRPTADCTAPPCAPAPAVHD